MRSFWEFLLVALVVTLTPGPATALVLRVTARDGRRAALGTVVGNSIGIFVWATLSAVGVSSLILASEIAFDVLRIGGAAILVYLGVRSILRRHDDEPVEMPRRRAGIRTGIITSLANPKLAVFFVALFPQFLSPGTAVLPAAFLMAVVIVSFDVLYFGTLVWLVHRAGTFLKPRVRQWMERTTGGVMIALGVRVAAEGR
jgi:threonine/homoserine/homoserine lactone efflux protein